MWYNECVSDAWAFRRGSAGVGDASASLKLIRIQLKPAVWLKDDTLQSKEQRDQALHQFPTAEKRMSVNFGSPNKRVEFSFRDYSMDKNTKSLYE